MSQGSLDFGRDTRVSEAQRAVFRTLSDVVDAVGLLQCAGACGCTTSELSDALAHRKSRYMRIEWLLALLDIAPPDFRVRLGNAIVSQVGYALKPKATVKPEEKLAATRERIAARFGAAGLDLLSELDADLEGATR